jgi:hypothetical protein
MKASIFFLLCIAISSVSIAQYGISPKGDRVLIDSSKWKLKNQRLSLKTSGNVGIGTSKPSSKLFIDTARLAKNIPPLKIRSPFSGAETDSILCWQGSDYSVRKIRYASLQQSYATVIIRYSNYTITENDEVIIQLKEGTTVSLPAAIVQKKYYQISNRSPRPIQISGKIDGKEQLAWLAPSDYIWVVGNGNSWVSLYNNTAADIMGLILSGSNLTAYNAAVKDSLIEMKLKPEEIARLYYLNKYGDLVDEDFVTHVDISVSYVSNIPGPNITVAPSSERTYVIRTNGYGLGKRSYTMMNLSSLPNLSQYQIISLSSIPVQSDNYLVIKGGVACGFPANYGITVTSYNNLFGVASDTDAYYVQSSLGTAAVKMNGRACIQFWAK